MQTDHLHARWRVAQPGRLLWRNWDRQHLIYHTGSGDTLVLDDQGAKILRLIEQASNPPAGGITIDQLIAQLGGLPVDHLLAQLAQQHVIELGR